VSINSATADSYYRPNKFEIATSWVHGLVSGPRLPDSRNDPRSCLDDILRPCLIDGPCFVGFSGGRDSSALLAAATALARREGLVDPVPVTEVYPGVPGTDEDEWQRVIIEHLELEEWVRLTFGNENDLIGDTAQRGLRGRGLIWPAPLQVKANVLTELDAGWFLTGEGGDEVFGPRRASALRALAGCWRHPRRTAVRAAVGASLPYPVRRGRLARQLRRSGMQPWLRPDVAERHLELLSADLASESLRWRTMWSQRHRGMLALTKNYQALAAEYGMRLAEPFLDPRFLAALSGSGGPLGYPDRTEFMRALFADVLPAAVLERRTKAYFNRAYFGEATREFARGWDGSGLDADLVDGERLQQEWLADMPAAQSMSLLQSAWLGTHGRYGAP